jgi:hypothetical protein
MLQQDHGGAGERGRGREEERERESERERERRERERKRRNRKRKKEVGEGELRRVRRGKEQKFPFIEGLTLHQAQSPLHDYLS